MNARAKTRKDVPLSERPDRFLNRELSWLDFNTRVLDESRNAQHPLLERLRFLSISASNLEEFNMVRYAGLREQVRAGISRRSLDGLTPAQQVARIESATRKLVRAQQERWREMRDELADQGITVIRPRDLRKSERMWLEDHFHARIFPILTPLAVDPAQPFPFIPNLGFAIAMTLVSETEQDVVTGLVPLPSFTRRFIKLPKEEERSQKEKFIPLEDVIPMFIGQLFPGYELSSQVVFRVERDSDIEIEEEAEDLIAELELLLRQRRRGKVVRLSLERSGPEELKTMVQRGLDAEGQDVLTYDGLLGLSQLNQLITGERPGLMFEPYEPRNPERIREHGGDIFAAIAQKDFIVHHPYESFDAVAQFVQQAARDPDVLAIKQTVYRTTADSPIAVALIEAAEAGKNVTALVELKARFDEEANLRLARDLERAGVQVVYGFIEYKTHAKMSVVIRREGQALRTYTHFGTGNYHPITARIYTDLSLFTADPALGRDAGKIFNYITAYRQPPFHGPDLERIKMSPVDLETHLVELIDKEAEHALAGKPSGIWAKMNSLVDPDVIDALYRASQAGVPIELVVRGICCLRPGVPNLSETIRVRSLIGRFLEHSRIACFANGHALPSPEAKVFISSADWMSRNLKRRVEALVPVETQTVHRQVLNQVMVANLKDEAQSWVMDGDGTYKRHPGHDDPDAFSAHTYFMRNPSLSGRGSASQVDLPPRLDPELEDDPMPSPGAAAAG